MSKKILFPHAEIREIQKDMVEEIVKCLEKGKSLIANAPTGLGKTAASLAPALAYAFENKKTVFFLTSRHTQHKIAIETLKQIRDRHGKDFIVADIIGKKHMCLQPGVESLYTSEFFEYCKALKEDGRCDFHSRTYAKSKLSIDAAKTINELMITGANSTAEIIEICKSSKPELCPYEISQELAKEAKVIIADYYYIFSEWIREPFMKKIGKELKDIIVIVDEAHNLPGRIRELMTIRLSSNMLERAIKEAKKLKYDESAYTIKQIKDAVAELSNNMHNGEERMLTKDNFIKIVDSIGNSPGSYEEIQEDLESAGTEIREQKKRSYVGSVADFIKTWPGEDRGFVRYIKKEDDGNIVISYRCLDPGIFTKSIMDSAHSVIMMSGTLTPTSMYRDLLGFDIENVKEAEYESPFPEENRLNLIVPVTSTKFTARSDSQFKNIAEISADIANSIKGNCALFFPSYYVKSQVERHFKDLYEKTLFSEDARMTNDEKHSLIEKFKKYSNIGAALLAVASGSYGEGIDLPGDLLKGVIVIGLPLQKPDLETKELIAYYDKKFGKGWDYGYLFPAFNKTLQNAGRCIRSKSDKGIIVFLDERYAWSNYYRCFPNSMKIKVTKNYKEEIVDFFW
jgi:DNA excision repair protein ERCC-2